jgi:SAM-dependent methyltransferase
MLRGFIDRNKALCTWIEERLPTAFTRSLLYRHELAVAETMNRRPGVVVVDIGGGRSAPFARHRRDPQAALIVGIDILPAQLAENRSIDLRIAADASRSLPLRDASVDVIATRSVLEHLSASGTIFAEIHRVLRPGGFCLHVFPTGYAPFALINRLLPNTLSRRLLHGLFPEWASECGFPAYYSDCHFPEIVRRHAAAGFSIARIEFRYYQSIYFKFFVPFYLISLLYDLALYALDVRRLACQILIVGRKPASGAASADSTRALELAHDGGDPAGVALPG